MKRTHCCRLPLLALAVALLVGPSPAVLANPACSCLNQNLCTEINDTPAIFAGHVLSITLYDTFTHVRMAVFTTFKGTAADTIDVLTGTWDGDCGVDFTLGPDYLVFAWGPYNPPPGTYPEDITSHYWTGLCSRTRPYDPDDPIIPFLTECATPTVPSTWSGLKLRTSR